MERAKLADLVVQFTEAFNRNDLDGVMSFMAEDAVYDEFNGTINRGTAAIRAAFEPQFRGDYGSSASTPRTSSWTRPRARRWSAGSARLRPSAGRRRGGGSTSS